MLYLSLAFVLVLPLFGVMAMEAGEVSPFIDEPGGPNGASVAYLVHLAAFFLAFFLVMRRRRTARAVAASTPPVLSDARLDRFAMLCVLTFVALALIFIFAFGAIGVFTLEVDKAEFRISLGPLGAIITLATKWLMPAMFAALVRACADMGWTRKRKLLVAAAGVSLCVFGAAAGFKTTVLQMLLPALILANWRVRWRTLAWITLFVVVNVVGLALLFDQHGDLQLALDALWYRLTVLQSDLTWYTWDKVVAGQETPGYLRTFLPVFGDGMLRFLTGASQDRDYETWASYYYGPAMTLFGGYPVEGLLAGVNNQATLFAETAIIGGAYFFWVASFTFGLITGGIALRLRSAIEERRYATAATLATFFSFTVLMWALGNGLSSFIYLINIVGTVGNYLFLRSQLSTPRRVLQARFA